MAEENKQKRAPRGDVWNRLVTYLRNYAPQAKIPPYAYPIYLHKPRRHCMLMTLINKRGDSCARSCPASLYCFTRSFWFGDKCQYERYKVCK